MISTRVTEIGVFRSDTPFDRKQLPVMKGLSAYYTPDVLKQVLLPIISHTGKQNRISLRALDWLVTNYSKKHPILYVVKADHMPGKLINMYTEYKAWLNKYRRTHFDPFRRKHKMKFTVEGVEYNTTVGQLNFMYWASKYGVIEYAKQHIDEIERDHAHVLKHKKRHTGTKTKRRQLSQAPTKKVFVYGNPVSVSFQPGEEDE